MVAFFACNPFPFISPVQVVELDRFGYVTYLFEGHPVKHRPLFIREDNPGQQLARQLSALEAEYRDGGLSEQLVERLRMTLEDAGAGHLNLARLDSLQERVSHVG